MAFLPYQKEKNPDIYQKYDAKREQKENPQISRVKLFGFRSGAVYKMMLASFYYLFAGLYIFSGIYGEIKYLTFEPMDIVLMVLKYIFWILLFFSPAIFLSDFEYRKSLPVFRNYQASSSLIGLLIVWMFCYFMANVNIYCMSPTYQESLRKYNEQLQLEMQKAGENTATDILQTTEEVSTTETVTEQAN